MASKSLSESNAMMQAMYGIYAMHVPLNIIIQGDPKNPLVTIMGQSHLPITPHPLLFGSKKVHQLILGDAIIRPHIVLETSAFTGRGAAGLLTMSPCSWLEAEHNILLNQTGDLEKRLRIY